MVTRQCKFACNLEFAWTVVDSVHLFRDSIYGDLWYDEVGFCRDKNAELLEYGVGVGHVGLYEHWVSI